jgi:hypothetical protein
VAKPAGDHIRLGGFVPLNPASFNSIDNQIVPIAATRRHFGTYHCGEKWQCSAFFQVREDRPAKAG